MWQTSIGMSGRLFYYYYTQTENIQNFEQRVVSVYTMRKLAESVVATRIHQEIIAHARLSKCNQRFPAGLWAERVCLYYRLCGSVREVLVDLWFNDVTPGIVTYHVGKISIAKFSSELIS
jgi:hypothetical protein